MHVLADCGVTLSQEEMLDALWLARALAGPAEALPLRREATPRQAPPRTTRPRFEHRDRQPRRTGRADLYGGPRPPSRQESAQSTSSTPEPDAPQQVTAPLNEGSRAMPLRVPEAKALSGELVIGRVLRPLKQSRPSTSRYHFDEQATVHALAATGLPDIVMRPAPERWLDLALVVDDGTSMALWQRLATELHALLRRAGAFRVIRTYGLHTRGEELYLRGRPFSPDSHRSRLRLLADPTGRTLILVLSDGVGRAWREGRMHRALHMWAGYGPTAVVHALPPRMWGGSALRAERWQVTSGRRGSPNTEWLITDPLLPPEVASFKGVPVPVLEPEPGPLAAWVNLVASPAASAPLSLLAASVSGQRQAADTGLPRLRRFHAAATPEAYRLAAHLAGVAPLSLPVMRLVQAAIPWAQTAHLAEVFLGGLLRPLPAPPSEPLPPQHQLFDFEAEAGEALINAVPLGDLVETGRNVSERLEQLAGRSPDFPAWLAHPEGIDRIPTSTRAFAAIGPRLASRFGVGSLERRLETVWRPLRAGDPWRIGEYTLHARAADSGGPKRFLGRDPSGTEVVVITSSTEQWDLLQAEVNALERMAGRFAPQLIAISARDSEPPWIAETHPHMTDGSPAMPLSAVLARDGFAPNAALEVALHLCEAVATSHDADLCHGGLSADTVQCLGRSVMLTEWFASRHATEREGVKPDIEALGTILAKLTSFAPDDLGQLAALIEACDPRHPDPTPSAHVLTEALSARLGMQQDDGRLVLQMDSSARSRLIRTTAPESRQVAVIGFPGAVGKSTTAAVLATVFATERADRTVVVDTDPGYGTLGFRVDRNTGLGMTALAEELEAGGYRRADPFVSRMASGAHVLTDLVGRRGPVAASIQSILTKLRDDYAVVITDSHSNVLDADPRTVLQRAHQLVIVVDSYEALLGRAGLEGFDRLRELGYQELLARSIIVVSSVSSPGNVKLAGIRVRPFELRDLCRGIVSIAYDRYLANSGEVDLENVGQHNRRAYADLAALVAQSFAP
ncbi:SAV_2336 N-terminal domain-related protein [Streptomyces sp. NPDC002402]